MTTPEPRLITLRENETLTGVTLSPAMAAALRATYRDGQLRVAPSWSLDVYKRQRYRYRYRNRYRSSISITITIAIAIH